MKKTVLFALCLVVAMVAQGRTVRDFFADETGELFVLLSKTARLDLLDYYDNDQIVEAKNNLGGGSSLIEVSDNFMSIKMSDSRTVQLLLVASRNDTTIVVVETYKTPVVDSRISFYNSQWQAIDGNKLFEMPTIAAFVRKDADKHVAASLLLDVPFDHISLSLEGEDHSLLVARHGLKEFLAPSEYKPFEKILTPSLMYRLSGKKWKLLK